MSNTNERAELIARLIRKADAWDYLQPGATRLNACRQAADMLEADVQEIARLREIARDAANAATQLQKQVIILKAQQVAVPTGWALVPIEPTPAILDAMSSSGWKTACYKAMLAAAQGVKLATKKDSKTDWSAA